ncbi:hypothetical protein O9992_27535 [Vibrio lentus]|nr:hypothetical protein [Vibrio lentus]
MEYAIETSLVVSYSSEESSPALAGAHLGALARRRTFGLRSLFRQMTQETGGRFAKLCGSFAPVQVHDEYR